VKNKLIGLVAVVGIALIATPAVYAATTYESTLTQSITAGTLSTSIRNASDAEVVTPSFAMTEATVSTSQQVATGTFGTSDKRIAVDNPSGASSWTLTLAATDGGSGKWASTGDNYAYNGATADAGQLTVNPTGATITAQIGGDTGIAKGSQETFSASKLSITLMSAGSGAAGIWKGYMTGVSLSQTIPPAQPAGSYSLPMTQTVASV